MPGLNKIFLEADGLVVGDNQLATTGGGVFINKSLSVGDGMAANTVTTTRVISDAVSANSITVTTSSITSLITNSATVATSVAVGNNIVNTTVITLGGGIIANNDPGQASYVLTSGGASANAYWTPLPAVVGINSGRAIAMALVFGT